MLDDHEYSAEVGQFPPGSITDGNDPSRDKYPREITVEEFGENSICEIDCE
jgi:hypothetical protein